MMQNSTAKTRAMQTSRGASGEHPQRATVSDVRTALARHLDKALKKVEAALQEPSLTILLHEARKAIKEYRALLRLVGTADAQHARRLAADVARSLSSARDRQACRDAVAALREADLLNAADAAHIITEIGPDVSEGREAQAHRDALRQWVSTARALHASQLIAQVATADIARNLRKGYASARRVTDWSEPVHLHELRKRAVTHRYQMAFFATVSGGRGTRRAEKAQKLREILGGYQDVETLKHYLAGWPEAQGDLRDLAIDAGSLYQRRLVKRARRAHEQLFRRSPRQFGQHLGLAQD
ncbi:CHAD domain-containing protein [Roseixanthobacter glucoisosaccharinicivorans]|uniref:CHAD domain-containing protein n=1 Tax=Roseixanthobacter glucoisosaccharinicivorans TaxID=3119923 RepID=UPI0037267969